MNIEYKNIKKINCKYFYPENKVEKVLLCLHGFAGDAESSAIAYLAQILGKENVLVISFDWPCHGNDKDNNCLALKNCFMYLNIVYEEIKAKYNNIDISVFATSFGAYTLLNYINKFKTDFKNIILRCPAIFMQDVLVNKLLPEHGYTLIDFDNSKIDLGYNRNIYVDKDFLKELQQNDLNNNHYEQKINIIQGDKDDVVDIEKNEIYFKNNFKNYKLYYINNANHRFKNPGDLEQIGEITKHIILNK